MGRMNKLLLIALILLSQNAFSQSLCTDLITAPVIHAGRSSAFTNAFAKVKNEVDTLIGPLAPAEVSVKRSLYFWDSQFNLETFEIVIGMQHKVRDLFLPQSLDHVTMAHEYGHALLEKNIPIAVEYDQSIRSSFHELFADVVAITYTRNPRSLRDLTQKFHPNYDNHMGRNFEVDTSLHYKDWKSKVTETIGIKNPYEMMNPVKWALWDIVKNKIHSDSYRKKIIPLFLKALKPYFVKWTERSRDYPDTIDTTEMVQVNQQIIKALYKSDLMNPI